MRTRGRLMFLAAFAMLLGVTTSAYATPTDVVDIITTKPDAITTEMQTEAFETMALAVGGNKDVAETLKTVAVSGTGGEFMRVFAATVQDGDLAGITDEAAGNLFNLLAFSQGNPAPGPVAMTRDAAAFAAAPVSTGASNPAAQQLVAAWRAATGMTATAAPQVATMLTEQIMDKGGPVGSRLNTLKNQRYAMAQRFGSDSASASYAMNEDFANRIWASPFYSHQKGKENGTIEGYKFNARGVSVGYDRAIGNITVGGAFTFSDGDYSAENVRDDNTIKSYYFSGYAQYYNPCNAFFASISGGYGYHDNKWNRFVEAGVNDWDRSKNHTNSYWFGGEVGKDFIFDLNDCGSSKFFITPTVGLYWSDSRASGSRWSAFDVKTDKIKQYALRLPVNIEARYVQEFSADSSLAVKVQTGYSYNFNNKGAHGSATWGDGSVGSWDIKGTTPGRHGYNVGGGVEYRYKNMDFGVDYRYDHYKKYDGHRVSATVGFNF